MALRARDLAKTLSLTDLFQGLTSVAEAVVQGSFQITQSEIFRQSPRLDGAFAIIAMGKFGGREITYYSDLDIIYLYEKLSDQERATRLGQRIISGLTILTHEGSAYPIDTALRPSGNRGTLVSTLDSFREYHTSMGRTWERQALIKARPILGEANFLKEIQQTFLQTSYRAYDAGVVAQEIHELRLRMEKELAKERSGYYNIKTGRGGLIDIEFATQFLQLIHGLAHPDIRSTSTLEALQALEIAGILEAPLAKSLSDAYVFYRNLETRIRLVLERSSDELIVAKDWMKTVEERFFPGEAVVEHYLDLREVVRDSYIKILGVSS
jgi:glutamate-ammonia-ligase adenylyltransferase